MTHNVFSINTEKIHFYITAGPIKKIQGPKGTRSLAWFIPVVG